MQQNKDDANTYVRKYANPIGIARKKEEFLKGLRDKLQLGEKLYNAEGEEYDEKYLGINKNDDKKTF